MAAPRRHGSSVKPARFFIVLSIGGCLILREYISVDRNCPPTWSFLMRVKAAIAFEAGKLLEIADVELDGPRDGEVLVELKATGICHTDAFTLSGDDPEGRFPTILGHEGAGIVVEIGKGVISVKPGDHVIPLYAPECRQCEYCLNRKTNLCVAIRATQGKGVMPDGTSRFRAGSEAVFHYMG